jgi:hypothetical protein
VSGKSGKLYTCFVDFRRAFDSIWREGLLVKLLRLGIGGRFYDIIKDMYRSTTCHVKLPHGITEGFKTEIGIKQGDGLSPLLFCLFIDDLAAEFNENCFPPSLGEQKINCLLYADDLILMSTTPTGLQNSLNALQQYCQKWHLEINTSKTKTMVFESQCTTPQNFSFTFGNRVIEKTDGYTYLGIYFDKTGSLKPAVSILKDKAQKAWFSARKTLVGNNFHSAPLMLKVFDTVVRPITTYGAEVWCQEFNSNLKFDSAAL